MIIDMSTMVSGAVIFYERYKARHEVVGSHATDAMFNRLVNVIGNPKTEPLEAYDGMRDAAQQIPDLFQAQSDSVPALESVEAAVGQYVNMIEERRNLLSSSAAIG